MRPRIVVASCTAVLLCGAGYLGGTAFASQSDRSAEEVATELPTFTKDLPAFTRLENGATVGGWRVDTPLDQRPDFVETRVDGKVGYLKLSDIDDGFVVPSGKSGSPIDTTEQFAAAERRQREAMVQPNEKGEIWAPVYDRDGVTVIGTRLMNPAADSEAP